MNNLLTVVTNNWNKLGRGGSEYIEILGSCRVMLPTVSDNGYTCCNACKKVGRRCNKFIANLCGLFVSNSEFISDKDRNLIRKSTLTPLKACVCTKTMNGNIYGWLMNAVSLLSHLQGH